MTREQTIEKLKTLYTNAVAAMLRADACDDDESAKVMTEYAETLDSAITALTALQTDGDCISRRGAIEAINELHDKPNAWLDLAVDALENLPSVQPDLSEAYAKAVRNWLVKYQVRTAELKARYTPYEVLGWVVSDWRKDNEIW